ncbi:MAG: polyprenyl synthetase family protein, partial [Bacilli bacterium]
KDLDDIVLLGSYLGQAFQIQDDLIEKTQSIDIIGKSKTDEINNKQTIVNLIGIEKAKILVESYYDKIDEILFKQHLNGTRFSLLLSYMRDRTH